MGILEATPQVAGQQQQHLSHGSENQKHLDREFWASLRGNSR